MDPKFVYPRPQIPIPRPNPTAHYTITPTGSNGEVNRQSNALRASVLDAALQLGLGSNNTVANWMFNNSLEEEEEELPSPALAYGTSEESSTSSVPYPETPSTTSHPSNLKFYEQPHNADFQVKQPPKPLYPVNGAEPQVRTPEDNPLTFPPVPVPPRPVTPSGNGRNKLKKKRSDGYESDGGYISEAGKRKKDKKKDTMKGGVSTSGDGSSAMDADSTLDKRERAKEAKARIKEEKMHEKREKEEEKRKKKDLALMAKASKKASDKDRVAGYETDGGTSRAKSKNVKSKSSSDAGYETDSGYVSSTPSGLKAKSKSRFFRFGTKQSKSDLSHEREEKETPPPLPTLEKEVIPLPIASRFATTLGSIASISEAPASSSGASIDTTHSSPFPVTNSLSYTTTTTPASSIRPTPDRSSYGSAESAASSSSSPKRRGLNLVTSAAHIPLPPSALTSPAPSISSSKLPAISLPLTRSGTTLPLSPTANHSKFSQNIPASSLHYSQSPTSRIHSRASSPNLGGRPSGPPSIHLRSTSPTPSQQTRVRFTDGMDRPNPSPSLESMSNRNQQLQPTMHPPAPDEHVIPSSDYIVPSPRGTPLPSPSVLAYYDIPPASPAPAGPLPRTPSISANVNASGSSFAHPMRARNAGIANSARATTPDQGLYAPNIQRGRESPFPARPILPSAGSGSGGIGTGLEARVKVARYRDLYALAIPPGGWSPGDIVRPRQSNEENPGIHVIEPTDDGWDDYDEEEEEGMRNVLERFEDARMDVETGRALGRSRSFEAIRRRLPERDRGDYYDDDEGTSTEESGGQRSNRWSGSIYSRTSFMDPEKSEEARERFVKRVGDMYDSGGREKIRAGSAIPPVPKLPDSFVRPGATAPGKNWNRF